MRSGEANALFADTLCYLFSRFSVLTVRYAVLRNYSNLPYSLGARDLDLAVHPDDLQAARVAICDVAEKYECKFVRVYRDDMLESFTVTKRDRENRLFSLLIDLLPGRTVYGVELLSPDEVLRSSKEHNGIKVVGDTYVFLDKWLWHLVIGRPTSGRYDAEYARIARENQGSLTERIGRLLGDSEAEKRLRVIAEGHCSSLLPLCPFARVGVLYRIAFRSGVSGLVRVLRFLYYRVRDHVAPSGMFLSVSGPDGSGKTTVINLALEQLTYLYGSDNVGYRHFRPALLPRIAEVVRSVNAAVEVDEDYAHPHRTAPSGKIQSLARIIYYLLDYFLGYFRKIRPELVKRRIVLYDRYFFDMICDPGRSCIDLPTPLLRFCARLLPLPDFAFFVRVNPAEVHRRKQELTPEKIEALNARYDDLTTRGWLIAIDNDASPQQAADAIVDHIVAACDRSCRKSLRASGTLS